MMGRVKGLIDCPGGKNFPRVSTNGAHCTEATTPPFIPLACPFPLCPPLSNSRREFMQAFINTQKHYSRFNANPTPTHLFRAHHPDGKVAACASTCTEQSLNCLCFTRIAVAHAPLYHSIEMNEQPTFRDRKAPYFVGFSHPPHIQRTVCKP